MKGYWQIPLEARSPEKTAFITPGGLYLFVRMPFRLHEAPATFQNLMDQLLAPHLHYDNAYLNDAVIYSWDWDKHLNQVAAVLQTLQDAGLTANPRKCCIGWRETTYLGYTLGQGTLQPLIGKVQVLKEYPIPAIKKQVRQFLGLAGYYRWFVLNFTTLATPLETLC